MTSFLVALGHSLEESARLWCKQSCLWLEWANFPKKCGACQEINYKVSELLKELMVAEIRD